VNWDIFRAYDIRGVYPKDLDEEAYYRIAKAYTYLFHPKTVVVGRDARVTSAQLAESLISGFVDAGVDVIDIGGITTDMLYFAVGAYDYSGGIVVSLASGNAAVATPTASSVTIPGGATTGSFSVRTSHPASSTSASIYATVYGVRKSAALTVTR